MALVVLLRGVNVGGHRRFRPSTVVEELRHLDVSNIGAAGTFVVRAPVARSKLRAQFARILPFDAEIAICDASEIAALPSHEFDAPHEAVRFVSVLCRASRSAPKLPIQFPSRGTWLVNVVAREGRFVFGLYRRHMKVIGYLGELDRVFGVPAITRNWNTIGAIGRKLG
jgi:uncharacterized protein (DUF1697 family)